MLELDLLTAGSASVSFVIPIENSPSVTSPASLEIQIAAERFTAIVTSRARVVAGRKMLLRARRADLSFLRQPARVAVTV